jgi:hypothetical protein
VQLDTMKNVSENFLGVHFYQVKKWSKFFDIWEKKLGAKAKSRLKQAQARVAEFLTNHRCN